MKNSKHTSMQISAFFVLARLGIGLLFILSGFEKVIKPYQNFAYVLEAYELFPVVVNNLIAQIFPWIELIVGVFLVLGLWTRYALSAACMMFVVFIFAIGQSLWRGLPLEQCGCFGQLIHIAPKHMILLDSFSLLLCFLLLNKLPQTNRFSLDNYLQR